MSRVENLCQSFPDIAHCNVRRDNVIELIESYLVENKLIFLEGDEGVGKTTILAQFFRNHASNTIAYFLKPSCQFSSDLGIIGREIYSQINYLADKTIDVDCINYDYSKIKHGMYNLHRKANIERTNIYVILDGFCDENTFSLGLLTNLIDSLPVGYERFRFIFSGQRATIVDSIFKKLNLKIVPVTAFSEKEGLEYFEDTELSKDVLLDILSITKNPGLLSGVKRMVKNGDELNYENLAKGGGRGIFEEEWSQVDKDDKCTVMSLAIVCFNKTLTSVAGIAEILKADDGVISSAVEGLSFLGISEAGNIEFKSELFRKFVQSRLDDYRGEVNDLIIDSLMSGPVDSTSISLVPSLLSEAGEYERLLGFLSAECFHKVIDNCQSLYPLQGAADLGVEAAYNSKSDNDLMRLGLQRSIMTDLDQGEIVRSEVSARLALSDEEAAITIAHSCPTREERLHALALIVRAKHEKGLDNSAEITEEISQLCLLVDSSKIGDKAFDIAETLSLSHPELAVEFLEKARVGEDSEEELDLSLVKLSFSTLGFNSQKNSEGEAFNAVHSKIKNPKVKKFVSAFALLFNEYGASRVLDGVEHFEGANEKIIFLKEWLKASRKKKGAGAVVDRALDLIIGASEYSPTAKDYREIATPLPCLVDALERARLTDKITEQKSIIEEIGPTEEVIQLDLILAHSRFVDSPLEGLECYVDIFFRICSVEDIIVKTICLSYFIVNLKFVDKDRFLEERESLHSISDDEFAVCIDKLLGTTAQQYDAVANVIKPLARHCPEKAIELVGLLNVLDSRDRAYCDIVKYGTDRASSGISCSELKGVIDKISDYEIKDRALVHFVENISSKSDVEESDVEGSISLFSLVPKIQDLEVRCRISCRSINFLKNFDSEKAKKMIKVLIESIDDTFESIDIKWVKVNIGLLLSRHISSYSIEIARNYYGKVEEIRNDDLIDSYSYALNYLSCIYLSIRSFAGLLSRSGYCQDDFQKIIKLIEDVPSYTERAKLFSILSLNLHLYKKHELFKKIVSNNLLKCIEAVPECGNKNDLICKVSPTLFLHHKLIAFTYIDKLPLPQRDNAIYGIIDYIFKKTPPNDPFESFRGHKYKLLWEEILDICDLLGRLDSDSAIYHVIDRLSESTTGKRSIILSNQQRTALVSSLSKIVTKLLPRPDHITHFGFKIISNAKILKIKTSSLKSEWCQLVESARLVPNLADKIYVLGVIVATMSSKFRRDFDDIIPEVVSLIDQMPSIVDRISRYEDMADRLKEINSAVSRDCLRRAMDVTRGNDRPDFMSTRRNLVDLAYRIDPEYALNLTSVFDDDPARIKSKDDLKKHYRFLENKKRMGESLESKDKLSDEFIENLSSTCWKSLGSINAGRYRSLHVDNVRRIIELASRKPMSEAFPILSFGIQNINMRYQNTDDANKFIRPLFDAVLVSADLAKSMSRRTSKFIDIAKSDIDISYENKVLIKPGDRSKAVEYILKIIENSTSRYIKICDNFFGKDDLEWLQHIATVKPKARIHILTSKKQLKADGITGDYEDAFSMHWRVNVSDQPPPHSDVTVVGTASKGDLPIHDRWILLEDCGIRIGTSLKSIGVSKDAELSVLSDEARHEFEANVDQFLSRSIRERDGEKISIVTFSL